MKEGIPRLSRGVGWGGRGGAGKNTVLIASTVGVPQGNSQGIVGVNTMQIWVYKQVHKRQAKLTDKRSPTTSSSSVQKANKELCV